jgi:hypothetical protein
MIVEILVTAIPSSQKSIVAFNLAANQRHTSLIRSITARDEILLGIIGPGRISSDETSRMEPASVVRSTATVVIAATVVTPVMIAAAVTIAAATVTIAAEATGAGVTAGIAIAITAGEGSRSRAVPTTATPS